MSIRLIAGDCRDVLPTLAADSVQCVVTSPPYYALRSYLDAAHPDKHREIGSESSPDEYLATMVAVFREVRRVLRPDGTCWVNMGDSYAGSPAGNKTLSSPFEGGAYRSNTGMKTSRPGNPAKNGGNSNRDGVGSVPGLAAKQLLLMPARLALALQADGWWVRSAIVWAKPNPMPESCRDRPTSAYEMVYLLTKRATYYYDADAVREEAQYGYSPDTASWHDIADANTAGSRLKRTSTPGNGGSRNLRNVWTIATSPFSAAHFATFPPELAERCIRAGTRPGDTVLDPFIGAGTTALVADRLQRHCIGIDLNVAYTEMAMERCRADAPLFTSFPPAEDPEEARMADLFADAEYHQLPPRKLNAFRNSERYVNQGLQPSNGMPEAAE